ncbi:MAG: SurA N-terminal domain-containing protein [Pseudomonadota bacterium]
MLNSFRNALRGVLAWVVGGLIILAMAVVGVPALDNFGSGAALTIGKTEYSGREFELEVRNRVQQAQAQNPNLTRDQLISAGIAQEAIQILTLRGLLTNAANDLGLAAPTDIVRLYIENIDELKSPETGRFNAQLLTIALQQQGISLDAFGDLVAEDLKRGQLTGALSTPATAPQDLTRLLLLNEFEQRTIKVAELTRDAVEPPTEEDIAAYYEVNSGFYLSPEYRTFTVLTISTEDVSDDISVSEEDVQQLYNARVGANEAAETRNYRQVTISADDAKSAASDAVSAGGGFDAVVEATGAAVTELSERTRDGFINEDLAEAVFAGEAGALLGPISTPFGDLYAEVTAINASDVESFEDLRETLEAELIAEIAEERVIELVEGVEIARDEGTTLAEAATSLSLEARTVGPIDRELFTRNGSIASINRILAAEGSRLEEGEESPGIRLADGYGFVTVESIVPPAPLALAEVEAEIREALEAERADDASRQIGVQFAAQEAAGVSFEEAAQALGSEVRTETLARDTQSAIPNDVVSQILELAVGQTTTIPGSGDIVYAVRVENVTYSDATEAMAVLPLVNNQFGDQLTNELYQAYVLALEGETEVRQNDRVISRSLGLTE